MTSADLKQRFPQLSSRAYEHPSDRAALAALRKVPGFDTVVRRLFGAVGDRALRMAFLASAVRVNERQLPELHRRLLEACEVLDVVPPELFVAQTPFVNAGAIGVDRPFIVLNSGILALLDEAELQFVIGHELGHVLSGHALYKTILRLLLSMTPLAFSVPLGGAALLAVTAALLEWDRCSELSADRAGLLVAQSPEVALRATMKVAGGSAAGLDLDEFVRQAEEYNASGNLADSVMKLLNLMGQPHPFPVLRVAELKKWAEGGAYAEILGGAYPRRGGEAQRSVYEELLGASKGYRDAFAESRDPLTRAVRGAHSRAQDFGRKVWASLRRDRQGKAPTPGPAAKRAPRKPRGGKAAGRRSRARPVSKKRGRS
jgi:Zn-dependent protease with chaperone function